MKPLYLITTVLAVLLINNLILLNFVGYFEDKLPAPMVVNTAAPVVLSVDTPSKNRLPLDEDVNQDRAEPIDKLVQESGDDVFIESFQRVATTGAFIDIMDRWQIEAQKRYQEFSLQLEGKSESELYELAMNADSLYEQRTALQKLMQGNMSKLSIDQLKSLYHNEDAATWSKAHILSALLDKNDAESVELAKQVLQKDPKSTLLGVNLLQRIYDKDPKFVARFVEGVGLDSRYSAHSIVSLLLAEPDLADGYMSKHFDQALESDNPWIHELRLGHVDFKLSDHHQESLLQLMSDDNRQKRKFALGFAHRIRDMDALRHTFGTLVNDRDKKTFLTSLTQKNSTAERKQLARQLASEMDDPEILRQFQ